MQVFLSATIITTIITFPLIAAAERNRAMGIVQPVYMILTDANRYFCLSFDPESAVFAVSDGYELDADVKMTDTFPASFLACMSSMDISLVSS